MTTRNNRRGLADAEYLTLYLGPSTSTPINPANNFLLVLATPDFANSTYNFILAPTESHQAGISLVYHHKIFRLPFIPVGEENHLLLQELGRIPSWLWEKVLEIASTVLRLAETTARPTPVTWDHAFIDALEKERIVPAGSRVEYARRLAEIEQLADASRGAGVVHMMDVDPIGGGLGHGEGVLEWLARLDDIQEDLV
ncbi:hypothetical protein BJX64DRAFT_289595 [Aspergillus heterothallicus]